MPPADPNDSPRYARPGDPPWLQDLASQARDQSQQKIILWLLNCLILIAMGLSGWALLTMVAHSSRLERLEADQAFVRQQQTEFARRVQERLTVLEQTDQTRKLAVQEERLQVQRADLTRTRDELQAQIRSLHQRVQQLERARPPPGSPPREPF